MTWVIEECRKQLEKCSTNYKQNLWYWIDDRPCINGIWKDISYCSYHDNDFFSMFLQLPFLWKSKQEFCTIYFICRKEITNLIKLLYCEGLLLYSIRWSCTSPTHVIENMQLLMQVCFMKVITFNHLTCFLYCTLWWFRNSVCS